MIEVDLADAGKHALAEGYSGDHDVASLRRRSGSGEFEPVTVDQFTTVEAEDAVTVAEMPAGGKRPRVHGTTSVRNLNAPKSSPTGGRRTRAFEAMQATLHTDQLFVSHVTTRAAGVRHIGYGPYKSENQDEFHIQVGR